MFLSWIKCAGNLPPSTRTVKALTEVEAFALIADEVKFITSQFRRIHSRQVQHTFRFYSQQWRTWAASFIQAAWRRYSRRKLLELHRFEEEDDDGSVDYSEVDDDNDNINNNNDNNNDDINEESALIKGRPSSSSFGATMYASKFATNAMKQVQRRRGVSTGFISLQKPSEPDFAAE